MSRFGFSGTVDSGYYAGGYYSDASWNSGWTEIHGVLQVVC